MKVDKICSLQGCEKTEGLRRCSKCRSALYCSSAHQKQHWSEHRRVCTLPKEVDEKRPTVALFDAGPPDWKLAGRSYYQPFLHDLNTAAFVRTCGTKGALCAVLAQSPPPHAVLVVEPSIYKKGTFAEDLDALLSYARNGGRVVFGCMIPSEMSDSIAEKFFGEKLGLPWRLGGYYRSTHFLQRFHHALGSPASASLLASYSMKAVSLSGVEASDAVYRPGEDSHVESFVFDPDSVDQSLVPVAMTRYEKGWIGWNGDVNAEDGSTYVLLAMLGL
ncbi:uncharacterized protein EI90DRAFT_3083062 [Cantharellus anzutake]|uniref:uncharacterized protein n=1 Tax=Cantharellus anzutake TaxID=1750568 RepID=UPI001907FD19|nr:uncharacterized protein EI90DRAFT_3083062 [Cantharellus anzutake]KAF8318594.1 hypothetical protein EI90DRAFT_3083062 [Cantharellus anzutake]